MEVDIPLSVQSIESTFEIELAALQLMAMSLPTLELLYKQIDRIDDLHTRLQLALQTHYGPQEQSDDGTESGSSMDLSFGPQSKEDKVTSRLIKRIQSHHADLRSRANAMSRTMLASNHRAQALPYDIWYMIFAELSIQKRIEAGMVQFNYFPVDLYARIATLAAARLSCRFLHDIVTPILFQIVHVRLDRSGMTRIDALTRNPQIAKVIRGVEVRLDEVSKRETRDFHTYLGRVRHIVDILRSSCDHDLPYRRGEMSDDFRRRRRATSQYFRNLGKHVRFWEKFEDQQQRGTKSWNDSVYGTNTRLWFQYSLVMCRQRSEDQAEIVMNGTFVKHFAAAMTRCHHSIALCLKDRPHAHSALVDAIALAQNRRKLVHYFARCNTWSRLELEGEEVEGEELEEEELEEEELEEKELREAACPARLLTELPMACSDAGSPIRGLLLECFPRVEHFHRIHLSLQKPSDELWPALEYALRDLESFELGLQEVPFDEGLDMEATATPGCEILDAYLVAALASPKLRTMDLLMDLYAWRTPEDWRFPERYYFSRCIINGVQSRHVTTVMLDSMSVSGHDFGEFLQLVAPTILVLDLCNITMYGGTIAAAMDSLRRRALEVSLSRPVQYSLSGVWGAEFGLEPNFPFDSLFPDIEESEAFLKELEGRELPDLLKQTCAYISGRPGMSNPLTPARSSVLQFSSW